MNCIHSWIQSFEEYRGAEQLTCGSQEVGGGGGRKDKERKVSVLAGSRSSLHFPFSFRLGCSLGDGVTHSGCFFLHQSNLEASLQTHPEVHLINLDTSQANQVDNQEKPLQSLNERLQER